jgi:hypothetical protein
VANLVNVTRYIAAGFARCDFHQLDSSGLPAGVTGTVTAGATGVAAGRITAVTTMNINIPASTPVPIPGDNILQGTFQFPSDAARSFEMQFSEDDFADRLAFQGIKTRNVGNHSFAGRDISPFALNNIMFIGVSNASAQAAGIKGLGMYAGVFATRAQMSIQGRNTFANRGAALFSGTVTLNAMDAYPWGETFQVANEGYTQSFIEDWTLAYPVTVHRWTQSGGAVTVFNLGETPASTSLDDVLVYVIDANGNANRQTAGVTISATNRTITFGVAPSAGLAIIAFYGYVPS